VLHVTNVETSNYYLNNLFDHTDRGEVEYSAVTLGARGSFVEEIERRGLKAYALDCPTRSRYPRAARGLVRIIRRDRVDIVHTHLFDPTVVGLFAAKARGRRVVVTRHHSDAVYAMPRGPRRSAYMLAEKRIYGAADHVIAPSRMVRDLLLEREGVPPSKVSLIPYGQTAERFDAVTAESVARVREELGMKGHVSIVNVSRLYKRKGHQYLFEAFARLVIEGLDANLYLVGAGPEEERLKALAREKGIEGRVFFLGWRDDALAVIRAADVIAHPSLEDALSSAVIESLMLERPVVATDISGVRDSLGDNEYGLIVPPADAQSLAAALAGVLSDLDSARERARRGRRHILEYMQPARVAGEYADCYRKVMGLSPLGPAVSA
jgi:glycosyltransferase involved in cell wall biosynthesis